MTYEFVDAGLVRLSTSVPRAGDVWPDLDGDAPDAAAAMRAWMRGVWADAVFAAAVELASPSLAVRVEDVCAGGDVTSADLRRAARALVKYRLRATRRATPFGLFAGVAPLRPGAGAAVRVGSGHRITTRVDAEWLAAVVRDLERVPELRSALPVVFNDLAFVRDGRLVLAVVSATGTGEVSIALRAPVRAVWEHLVHPVPVHDLVALLDGRFLEAPTSAAVALIDGLVEQGFLITALRPPTTATRPLRHVIDTALCTGAGSIPAAAAVVAELTAIDAACSPDDDIGRGWPVRTRMRALAEVDRPIGRDVLVDAEVVVPEVVTREAAAAATALVTLSPDPGGGAAWADYHRRFLDRYGIGATVAVTDLLHPDSGLGYPAGYRGSSLPAPPDRARGRRDEILLGLAHEALWAHRDEVELGDGDLRELAVADRPGSTPHTELRAEVHARSRQAVDTGEFRLVVLAASRAAGTLTGRFLDQLDAVDRVRMAEVYTRLPTVTAGALTVQVTGPPAAPRAGNIARSPSVLPDLITTATLDGREGRIALSDLAVGADTAGLYLMSRTRGVPVEPIVVSAIELVAAAHPTVRFLGEIATACTTACVGFTWGAARTLRHLPRLRYGRSVLAPARWTVPAGDLPTDPSGPSGRTAWEAWRQRWEVPDRVVLGQDDRRLPLDLTVSAHRHVLLTTIARRDRVTLTEAPGADAFGWTDGRAHELVLPLVSTAAPHHPPRPRPISSTGSTRAQQVHLPGAGDWLNAHLHVHPDRQATILAEHLPTLLDGLTADLGGAPEWWFIRHADPRPHLRLRVRLPRPSAFAPACARLGAWADVLRRSGLLGSLQLDTYRPETGRYGHGPAMAAAETVFAADSSAVLAQLRLPGPDLVRAVTAVGMLDLVTAFAPNDECGLRWLLAHAPRAALTPPARDLRARVVALCGPGGRRELAAAAGGDLVLAAWARRRAALHSYRSALLATGAIDPGLVQPDLLHLNHVRAAGPSLDDERACLHLARAVALSRTTRVTSAA